MERRRVTIVLAKSFRDWAARRPADNFDGVFLSPDAAFFDEIRASHGTRVRQPGEALHARLLSITSPLIELFNRTTVENDPMVWWGSQIASRSVSGTAAPLNIAYALCACDFLDDKESSSNLVFIVDSLALARVILNEARRRAITCVFHGDMQVMLRRAKLWIRPWVKLLQFLVTAVFRWFLVRWHRMPIPKPDSKLCIMRSWCTSGNIDAKGDFVDRNFGVLGSRLSEVGHDVWISPSIFRLDIPFSDLLCRMSAGRTRFLHVERVVSLLDIIRQGWLGARETNIRFERAVVEGCDVEEILRESVRQSSMLPDLMTYNLLYFALKRLKDYGATVDRFYYPMENNPFEKLPLLGLRKFHPAGTSYGFQHSAWFKHQYSMLILPEESKIHPLPDRILCSGSRYLEILTKCGFPRDRMRLSPSYRFTYALHAALGTAISMDGVAESSSNGILILPGFDPDHANDMVARCLRAVSRLLPEIRVYLKPHPACDMAAIQTIIDRNGRDRCEIVGGNTLDWIDRSAMVIDSGGSIAGLETILRGKPLLRCVPGSSYFLDPLWEEYPIPISFNEEQLAANIEKVIHGNFDRGQLQDLSKIVRLGYFEPDDARIPD